MDSSAAFLRSRLVRTRDALELVLLALTRTEENLLTKIRELTMQASHYRDLVNRCYQEAKENAKPIDSVSLQMHLTLAAKTCRQLAYAHRENNSVECKIADVQRKHTSIADSINMCEYNQSMVEVYQLLREAVPDKPILDKSDESKDIQVQDDAVVFENIDKMNDRFLKEIRTSGASNKYKGDARCDPEALMKNVFSGIPIAAEHWSFLNSELRKVPDEEIRKELNLEKRSKALQIRRRQGGPVEEAIPAAVTAMAPSGSRKKDEHKETLLRSEAEITRETDEKRSHFVIDHGLVDSYGMDETDLQEAIELETTSSVVESTTVQGCEEEEVSITKIREAEEVAAVVAAHL